MAVTNSAMIAANEARWSKAKITRQGAFPPVAKRLATPAAKSRYQVITDATKVPWQAIAVTHEREASQRFDRQLGQGDPLDRASTHVPKGRGPFLNHLNDLPGQDAFYRGAVDALMNCPPYAGRWNDWSVGGTLTLLEKYNGVGYAAKGRPSPYIWSGTDQYLSGKYVSDGVYDQNVIDQQLGCAGLLKAMMEVDPTINFGPPVANARPTPEPPKEIINDATKKERNARKGGIATGAAGAGNEAGKATTEVPSTKPFLHSYAAYAMIGVGVAVAIVATVLIGRKVKAITEIW
jgi:lysozyme family protein